MQPPKIEIIEQRPNYLRIRVYDDPHTYLNLLRDVLIEYDEVEHVGYAREKTFEDVAVFEILTKEDIDALQIIEKATNEIIEVTDRFLDVFENALEEESS